jgi:hypothetical protein
MANKKRRGAQTPENYAERDAPASCARRMNDVLASYETEQTKACIGSFLFHIIKDFKYDKQLLAS